MNIVERPSPNHDERQAGAIQILLLHYTGMLTAESALERMCDPEAKVSAHYMIDDDGTVYRLVPEDRRAWHAGEAAWRGQTDINSLSIGIELVNPGHEFMYRQYTEPQMGALIDLSQEIVQRHAIAPEFVLGHSDVAPRRKKDPGEKFQWSRLASVGVGLWPFKKPAIGLPQGPILKPGTEAAEVVAVQNLLSRFGYAVPQTGVLCPETIDVVMAFQRHFRPAGINGAIDTETAGRLVELVELIGV